MLIEIVTRRLSGIHGGWMNQSSLIGPKSMTATRQRILLQGPAGCAWYLGERVAIQILWISKPNVSKLSPRTMLFDYELIENDNLDKALNCSSAKKIVKILSFTNTNESKLVWIPWGQESPDLLLPKKVTHVTAEDATYLLELIVGLNDLETLKGAEHFDEGFSYRGGDDDDDDKPPLL
ncbi:unnamed protein product [Prunus armeniaca]